MQLLLPSDYPSFCQHPLPVPEGCDCEPALTVKTTTRQALFPLHTSFSAPAQRGWLALSWTPFQLLEYQWSEGEFDTLWELGSAHWAQGTPCSEGGVPSGQWVAVGRKKSENIFVSLCTSRKRVKAFCFHFSLLELQNPTLAGP